MLSNNRVRSRSLESGVTPRRLNQVVLPEPGNPMASTTMPLGMGISVRGRGAGICAGCGTLGAPTGGCCKPSCGGAAALEVGRTPPRGDLRRRRQPLRLLVPAERPGAGVGEPAKPGCGEVSPAKDDPLGGRAGALS